jgi:hypothetical protein
MTRGSELLGGNQFFSPIDHPLVYSMLQGILSRLYAIRAKQTKDRKIDRHDFQSFI